MKKCKRCGKQIIVKYKCLEKNRIYCSRECSREKPVDKKCLYCGNSFKAIPARIKTGREKYCSRKCYHSYRKENRIFFTGKNHGNWKGGRISLPSGYIIIYQPYHPYCTKSGYVFEHRLIAEKALGRFLKPEEIIHHINGVTDDNRLENLYLFPTPADHIHYHWNGIEGETVIVSNLFKHD